MLVRRFAVVCFVLMLFGMWFSSIVAGTERYSPVHAGQPACLIVDSPLCRTLVSY